MRNVVNVWIQVVDAVNEQAVVLFFRGTRCQISLPTEEVEGSMVYPEGVEFVQSGQQQRGELYLGRELAVVAGQRFVMRLLGRTAAVGVVLKDDKS